MSVGEQEINTRVLQIIRNEHIKVIRLWTQFDQTQHNLSDPCDLCLQYSVPVIKYNRNGFKPRPRQLILTQVAAYVIEEAKIKQRVLYTVLKGQNNITCFCFHTEWFFPHPVGLQSPFDLLLAGISVSNLTDRIIVFHIMCEDPKEKVCGCRSVCACAYSTFGLFRKATLHLRCMKMNEFMLWNENYNLSPLWPLQFYTNEAHFKVKDNFPMGTKEWPDAF